MHEGAKVKELLDGKGITPAAFARKAEVSPTAVYKWIATKEFKAGAWETCATALEKAEIDPSQVRAIAITMNRTKTPNVEEVKALVEGMDAKQFERIRKILDADPHTRARLRDFIEGALMVKR